MKTIRTVAELRAGAVAPPARGPHDRARADDGRVPRGPPVADAPGPRRMRRRRRLAVRQPDAVQRRVPTSTAYPRDEARDAALAGRARRRLPVRAGRRGGLPARLRDDRVRRRAHRRRSRARTAAARTSTASRPSSRSCSTWSRPTSPTSGRRTPSRRSSIQRLVRDLDMPVRIEVCADRPRAGRPRDVEPQRPPQRRASASAPPRCSRALDAIDAGLAAGVATPTRVVAAGRRPSCAPRRSSPSTSRSSPPRRSRRCSGSRARCSRSSPRASAPRD